MKSDIDDRLSRLDDHEDPLGDDGAGSDRRPGGSPPSHRRRSTGRRSRRVWRRRLAVLVVVVLIPVGWSYGNALAAPGSGGVGIRSVEWVRNHGGAGMVAWAENLWYTHHAPPKGGTPPPGYIKPPTAVAAQGASAPGTAPAGTGQAGSAPAGTPTSPSTTMPAGPAHLPPPKPMVPIASPALPGEGAWHPIGRTVHGIPAVYASDLRPDTVHTSLVTSVAWMDTKLLKARLFAGAKQPGGGPWPYMAPIAPNLRPSLVAAFNSGFKLSDAHGGYYSDGRMAAPLVKGAASFVIDKNGTATVAQWGRDATMGPNIASVRQNLTLIVDHGQPVTGLGSGSFLQWGATVGNKVLVWRSGVGVTADGALVYAAGKGLSVSSLANVLARAGAVRAMELDINSDWVNFFSFAPAPGQPALPANGTRLLPDMVRPPQRYFEATARDFIGMFAR